MDRLLIIAVPVLTVIAVLWWARNRKLGPTPTAVEVPAPRQLDSLLDTIDSTPDSPISFGYKMSWLAIKTPDAASVRDSLNIESVKPANWHTGFVAAYNGHTFISSAVDGWVFVVSQALPELGHASDEMEWTTLMSGMSRKFGDVQYFATHRVSGFSAWARYTNGEELRAFAYCDETLVNRSKKTAGELELGCNYFDSDSPDAESESYWEREDLSFPDEEHVMEIAGKWGINPQNLGQLNLPHGSGWIGNLVRVSKGAE